MHSIEQNDVLSGCIMKIQKLYNPLLTAFDVYVKTAFYTKKYKYQVIIMVFDAFLLLD